MTDVFLYIGKSCDHHQIYIHKFAVSSLLEAGCLIRHNFRVKILKEVYSRRKYLMVFLETLDRRKI